MGSGSSCGLRGIMGLESPPLSASLCVIYTVFAVLLPILRRIGKPRSDGPIGTLPGKNPLLMFFVQDEL
jgi:hypothetical protein